jgi:hypothetical protein
MIELHIWLELLVARLEACPSSTLDYLLEQPNPPSRSILPYSTKLKEDYLVSAMSCHIIEG